MKKQVKKFVGYVPKNETLEETFTQMFHQTNLNDVNKRFGMYSKEECEERKNDTSFLRMVKRTITITSEDEDGSTKARKKEKKGKKKTIAPTLVNKKSR